MRRPTVRSSQTLASWSLTPGRSRSRGQIKTRAVGSPEPTADQWETNSQRKIGSRARTNGSATSPPTSQTQMRGVGGQRPRIGVVGVTEVLAAGVAAGAARPTSRSGAAQPRCGIGRRPAVAGGLARANQGPTWRRKFLPRRADSPGRRVDVPDRQRETIVAPSLLLRGGGTKNKRKKRIVPVTINGRRGSQRQEFQSEEGLGDAESRRRKTEFICRLGRDKRARRVNDSGVRGLAARFSLKISAARAAAQQRACARRRAC